MLVLGNILPYLSLAVALVLLIVGVLASVAWFTRARAARPAEAPAAPAAAPSDPVASEMRALRDSIEHLVGQQQMQTETHRQQVGQKLEAVGHRLDEVGHRVSGLGNELRHEVRRRDAELEEIRHQIASIQRLGLPAGDSAALPPADHDRAPADGPQDAYEWQADGAASEESSSFFLTVSEIPASATPERPSLAEAGASAASTFDVSELEPSPFETASAGAETHEVEEDVPDVLSLVNAAFSTPQPVTALPEVAAEPEAEAEPEAVAAPEASAPAPAPARPSIFVPMDDFFGTATPKPVVDEGGWSAAPAPSLFEAAAPQSPEPPQVLAPAPTAEPEAEAPEAAPSDVLFVPEGADDLTVIASIDAATQQALYLAGVTSLDDIAHWGRSDARRIAAEVNVSEETIMHQWIFDAQAALFERYARQPSAF